MGTVPQKQGGTWASTAPESPTPSGQGNALPAVLTQDQVPAAWGEARLPHGGRKVCPELVAFYHLPDSWSKLILQQSLSAVGVFCHCVS